MILRVFKCQYCKQPFVIVKARSTYIPVNCKENDEFPENTVYERESMVSHIKTCKERQADWQNVLKTFIPGTRFTEIPDNLPPVAAIREAGETLIRKQYNPVIKDKEAYNASKEEFLNELKRGNE